MFGVLESTGEGDQGWWPDTWRFSKYGWPLNKSRLCPLFLPWFCGVDIYPTATWLRMRPVPSGFYSRRLPDTREHVAKAEAYVRSHPMLARHLSPNWTMPLEQQWFWEIGHEEAKAKGIEAKWYQEMAGDDIEALQRSSESVFGYEVMERVEHESKPSFSIYGFAGQSVEESFEAHTDDIDYSRERTSVVHRSRLGESYRWELIPLKHDEDYYESILDNRDAFYDYSNGKLFVWHPPQPGVDYSIGVDTGNGVGEDWTVISVTAVGKNGLPDVQAAEFRSCYVNHIEAYAFIAAIAAYYGAAMSEAGIHTQPMIGIEQLAAYGDTAQLQLRKMGFGRFPPHIRYDSKKVTKKKAHKVGWFTTAWTRPMLIDGFVHCIQNGWYVLNSPWTIDECKHFEIHYTSGGKEKKEHEDGEHDDGIFATAISTFIMHDLESMTQRSKKRFMGDLASKSLPPIDVGRYSTKVSTSGNPIVDLHDLAYPVDDRLERFRH